MKSKSPFKIYTDRLKDGDTENIFEVVESNFMILEEKELSFPEKVTVAGKAYLAKTHLILELKIKTKIQIPCSICNEPTIINIDIDDFAQTVELSEIKSAIYDFEDEVRNAILLKVPQFVECHLGSCPNRKDMKSYLKASDKKKEEDTYLPFSDL